MITYEGWEWNILRTVYIQEVLIVHRHLHRFYLTAVKMQERSGNSVYNTWNHNYAVYIQ